MCLIFMNMPDSDFLRALYSVYKKLGQFFFHSYLLTCFKKDKSVCQIFDIFEQVNKLNIKTILTF